MHRMTRLIVGALGIVLFSLLPPKEGVALVLPSEGLARLTAQYMRETGTLNLNEFWQPGESDAGQPFSRAMRMLKALGGGTLLVPIGTFTFTTPGIVDVDGVTILFAPGATAKLGVAGGNSAILLIQASNVTVDGGAFLGTWDKTQNRTATGGRVAYETLIKLDPDGGAITNLMIRDAVFSLAGDHAIYAYVGQVGESISDLTIDRCTFTDNYDAILFRNDFSAGTLSGLSVMNSLFDGTAFPPDGVRDSTKGGNAVTTQGTVHNVRVLTNTMRNVGRMNVELWVSGDDVSAGKIGSDVVIQGNHLDAAAYRNLSVTASNARVLANYIDDPASFTEFLGQGLLVEGNEFHSTGILTEWNPATDYQKSVYTSDWVIRHNTFYNNPVPSMGFLHIMQGRNVTFADNTMYDDVTPTSMVGIRGYIDVRNSRDIKIQRNTLITSAIEVKRLWLNLTNNQDGWVEDNIWYIAAGATVTVTNPAAVTFAANNRVTLAHNRILSKAVLSYQYAVMWPITNGIGGTRRSWNGAAWVDTAIVDLLNDPPAGLAENAVYLVGDVPTGAWTGHARSLATWAGGAWTYETVKGFIWYNATNPHAVDRTPVHGQAGDVYVITSAGSISNEIVGNRWDVNGNLNGALGQVVVWNYGLSFGNLWTDNDINPNYVRNRINGDSFGFGYADNPPTAGVHNKGEALLSRSPAAAGKVGWTCTVSGTPGTWKPFGAIDA